MASAQSILRVLDLLTTTPPARVETLRVGARTNTQSIRRIIESENVVAVGISEKISKQRPTGALALAFYVQKKMPVQQLSPEMVVPPRVPQDLSGAETIPTDVIVLGKIHPEIKAIRNPVQPGFSIGHVDGRSGTIGAIVTKSKADDFYILSNSHVLAECGTAKKGDDIIYPGNDDAGSAPADVVATLAKFEPFVLGGAFVNRVDAAIAKPTKARIGDILSEVKGLGIPKGTIKPQRGMKIIKVGRTSGKTHGEVRDVNFRFVLNFDEVGDVGFLDQVLCTRYTQPGDSGSLVLDQATGKAVGLHFAGANGGSVFSPIDEVLKALGVKLVTKAIGKQVAGSTKKSSKSGTAKKR